MTIRSLTVGLLAASCLNAAALGAQSGTDDETVTDRAIQQLIDDVASWPGLAGQPIYLRIDLSPAGGRTSPSTRRLPAALVERLQERGRIAGPCAPSPTGGCTGRATGVVIQVSEIRWASPSRGRLVGRVQPFWAPSADHLGSPAGVTVALEAERISVEPVGGAPAPGWLLRQAVVLTPAAPRLRGR